MVVETARESQEVLTMEAFQLLRQTTKRLLRQPMKSLSTVIVKMGAISSIKHQCSYINLNDNT